jgi:hypothetical protein
MKQSPSVARQPGRTGRRFHLVALALAAMAVGTLAGGCIEVVDHDPRDDGSRLDAARYAAAATGHGLQVN